MSEYAEAAALAGPGAVLDDDAVLAMHDLAQVNPRRLRVAVPHPLPAGASRRTTTSSVAGSRMSSPRRHP